VFIIYLLRIQLVTPIGALGATCQIDKCQKDINLQHDLSRFLKGKESMTMWLNKVACADQQRANILCWRSADLGRNPPVKRIQRAAGFSGLAYILLASPPINSRLFA
jgi:hypothetical protein